MCNYLSYIPTLNLVKHFSIKKMKGFKDIANGHYLIKRTANLIISRDLNGTKKLEVA